MTRYTIERRCGVCGSTIRISEEGERVPGYVDRELRRWNREHAHCICCCHIEITDGDPRQCPGTASGGSYEAFLRAM